MTKLEFAVDHEMAKLHSITLWLKFYGQKGILSFCKQIVSNINAAIVERNDWLSWYLDRYLVLLTDLSKPICLHFT